MIDVGVAAQHVVGRHEIVVAQPFGRLRIITQDHRAGRWAGTFSDFMERVLPHSPQELARSSHQYMWDMIRSSGIVDADGKFRCALFGDELFGIDEAIERVVDYFKAAAAG